MNWSWTLPAGLLEAASHNLPVVSQLEHEWGIKALLGLDEQGFKDAKLTASLLRYLCQERGIFEAGISSQHLIDDLNEWQKLSNIILADGARTPSAIRRFGDGADVGIARAHYYVSRDPWTRREAAEGI
ncbi:hypothetical protein FRC07_002962 [Ceratobasidium sp. 392]|nr:hypothetical protein FRC07_002962 [Ceratobasidium sp. 392]